MFPLFPRRTLPLILAFGAFALFATPAAVHAKAGDSGDAAGGIDVNFFYDTLKEDGSWYNTSEYGDVWQPYIAYKSDTWRPYTDGYWSYTDGGWMFVSNENFGWAVYHYGRWTRLKDIGWAWVPGTDWAPAWVTWRASKADNNGPPAGPDGVPAPGGAAAIDANSTNAPVTDDKNGPPATDQSAPPRSPSRDRSAGGPPPSDNYVGWAPLPPEPQAYTTVDYSYGPTVDVDYGIDPYDYCFTDVRYFGAPYVAAVIFDPFQSYYCCDRSVNITNVYYNHDGGYRGFYAGGPRYESFRGVTQRPIPQYNIRQTSGAAAQAAIRQGQFNRVNGRTIGVAAPQFSRAGIAPDGKVKLTRAGALAKAEVNRGAPAAAADNPAYKQARESFTKQGDTYRAQHPEAAGTHSRAAALGAAGLNGGGAQPETAPKIQTTTRAQEEERAARQTAGEKVTPAAGQSREEALKEHTAGGTPEAVHEKGGEPKATEARPEAAAPATAGETKRSRRGSHRQSAEGTATEGRRSEPVRHERSSETTSRSRVERAPHVEQQRSAPHPVAAPRPQGGGGGGGKQEDKKKK